MAQNSEALLSNLENYVSNPGASITLENEIRRAREGPVQTLIDEGQAAREQAYPEFFRAFSDYGTGAADMSPSARLAAAIGSGERAMSRYNNNLGLRDYYNTATDQLVDKALNAYNQNYNMSRDLYGLAYGREQDALEHDWRSQMFDYQKTQDAFGNQLALDQLGLQRDQFGHLQSQDSFGNQLALDQFGLQRDQFDFQKKMDEARLALQRASRGGGGGSTFDTAKFLAALGVYSSSLPTVNNQVGPYTKEYTESQGGYFPVFRG